MVGKVKKCAITKNNAHFFLVLFPYHPCHNQNGGEKGGLVTLVEFPIFFVGVSNQKTRDIDDISRDVELLLC